MNNNSPIQELMSKYTEENCDFTDMEWVRKAALRYVDSMEDCQVRCLLYALATNEQNAVTEAVKSLQPWLYHWKYSGCGVSFGKKYGTNKTCTCNLKEKLLEIGLSQEFTDKIKCQST